MSHAQHTATMYPAAWVREIATDDGAALLDIRNGMCLSLTPIAAEIWRLLTAHLTEHEISFVLKTKFPEIADETLCGDLSQYLVDLRNRNLLLDTEHTVCSISAPRFMRMFHPKRRKQTPNDEGSERAFNHLTAHAFIGLLLFDLVACKGSFVKVHSVVKDWPTASVSAPTDIVGRVCGAVNYACSWYPKRALCLQRAAITTCLLRRCGIDAKMVIGAQRFPFKAHAWTEVNGIPVNERRAVTEIYLVWERC